MLALEEHVATPLATGALVRVLEIRSLLAVGVAVFIRGIRARFCPMNDRDERGHAISSLTVVSSSFADSNSSFEVSSSSLMLCNSSLADWTSSFDACSSSFAASCCSRMDCK